MLRNLVIVLPKKKKKENTGKNPKIISELWKIPTQNKLEIVYERETVDLSSIAVSVML